MSKKNIALFFTAGLSDLKFVAEDGSLLELTKLRGQPEEYADIRAVHEALLALGAEGVAIQPFDPVPDGVPFDPDRSRNIGFLKPRAGEALLDQNPVDAGMNGHPLRRLADGSLLLAADKLRPVWDAIGGRPGLVRAVVGFRTLREGRNDEPVAAEPLIFEKLVARLDPIYSELVSYVQGTEKLELGGGAILPAAVERIERAVLACSLQLADERIDPWLAVTGGIPAVKDVVRAAVGLYFGTARSYQKGEQGIDASFRLAPQDGLIARRQALAFVRRGALIEAAAIAASFMDEHSRLQWILPLRCAARLLDGNPVAAYAQGQHPDAAEKWETKLVPPGFIVALAKQILPGANQPQHRCLLVGLRAEAALRARKWVEAINLSVSFLDAALRDTIEQILGCFVEDRRIRPRNPLTPQQRQALCETAHGVDGSPCLSPEGPDFRVRSSKAHDDAWYRFFGGALEEMNQKLEPDLRELRNRNTHAILDDQDIQKARRMFQDRGLWKRREPDGPLSFLDTAVSRTILSDLGYCGNNPFDEVLLVLERALLKLDLQGCS